MSFSIGNYLQSLMSAASSEFHFLWICTSTIFLYALFCIVLFVAITKKWKSLPDVLFILLASLLIVVFRLPSLVYGESNPDESQWLASVITMRHGLYDYFRDFYIYDFSRAMTIAPLWIVSLLGFSLDYALAKLVGVMCWIIFLWGYFFFIKDCFGKKTALLAGSIVAVFLATFISPDYVAYNSETPAVALVSVFLFFFNRSYLRSGKNSFVLSFVSGLMLSLVFFAKEQSAYIVGGLGVICCLTFFLQKAYLKILYFFAGGLLCGVLFITPFFIFNKSFVLVDWIRQTTNYLSLGLNFNHLKWSERLSFSYLEESVYFYTIPIYFLIVLVVIGNRRLFDWIRTKENFIPVSLISTLYAASFYTIMSPVDFFQHYILYFILPTACIIALCIRVALLINHQMTMAICVSMVFLLIAKHGLDELDIQFNPSKKIVAKSVLAKEILKYSQPGDNMLVWGWDCKLYVDTNLVRGSRYWYNQLLSPIYPVDFRNEVVKKYEQDFLVYQPKIVVQILEGGPVRYARPNIADYPSIGKILDEKYRLVYKTAVNRIYQRVALD